jgi:hypothetical protein
VDRAGQADSYINRTTIVPERLSDFSRLWNKNTPKTQPAQKEPYTKPCKTTPNRLRIDQQHHDPKTHESISSPETNPTSGIHRSDRSHTPVRPVKPGQLGMNNTCGSTPPNPNLDLPNCSTDLCKTLGIVGTPHGESIAKLLSTKTYQIKSNQRNSAKNSSNPRASKTQKSSPLTHEFGRGIKGKRTMKGSHIHPIPNPQEQGPENARHPPREGSENHHQEQTETTQPSLEEPRRIIYTYQRGSYKVWLAARSSNPLTRSHHEALKLVL